MSLLRTSRSSDVPLQRSASLAPARPALVFKRVTSLRQKQAPSALRVVRRLTRLSQKDVKNNKGEWEEKRLYFYPKISPIGQLDLNEDYISLIIKVVGFETTFYDLWNFSKDGKALSVICLFWGLRDDGPKSEEVTYTIVDSKITKEGLIKWHENADGLETFRTYKLNEDGYFEIIKEEREGEYEF
ncbi:MAG: hypothetical protein PWQ17_1333 [Anaerophaga sp.]|nr:hypothetical protein [Anaerophaga sp.]